LKREEGVEVRKRGTKLPIPFSWLRMLIIEIIGSEWGFRK
jgi:hypothetical protein